MKICRRGLHQYEGIRCPSCDKENKAAYYSANRERVKERASEWARKNPLRRKEIESIWYTQNRELVKKRASAWNTENPERHYAHTQTWRTTHPEAVLGIVHRRRARKGGNPGNEPVTAAHLELLFDAQDGLCRYCHAPLGKDKHLDHRIPLSRGGAHSPSNVCWSCPTCNLKKHTKTEGEFLQENP